MSNLTQTAKSISSGSVTERNQVKPTADIFSSFVGLLTAATVAAGIVAGAGTVGFGGAQNAAHAARYAASEVMSPSQSNYQVHGNLEQDGKAVIVSDSKNPSNYMVMKMSWDTESRYRGGTTYAHDKYGIGKNVIDISISPNSSTVQYDQLLRIAQKYAEKNHAAITLPDCSQTANNIAGYATTTLDYQTKSQNPDRKNASIDESVPVTYHQVAEYKKEGIDLRLKSHEFFGTYGNTVKYSDTVRNYPTEIDNKVSSGAPSSQIASDKEPVTANISVQNGSETPSFF